jgi:hypothetical protein
MTTYRKLSEAEISQLKQQRCSAENWDSIEVHPEFQAEYVSDTIFSGKIRLGAFKKSFVQEGGVPRHSGIRLATLHNCEVGDDSYICKIGNYISNYKIGRNVIIENVDLMAVFEKSSFGNGVKVCPLNEAGGREVPICNELSAHVAYMLALYRHRTKLIQNLQNIIEDYVSKVSSDMGEIGDNVVIRNCGCIKNVLVGPFATLKGCLELMNGSINSNESAPVHLGIGVIAKDFIISSGSDVNEGAMLDRCFVGQACQIGKQYSATDTLFFSNCQGFHGEAASVFAGPFTVTHHKSSLLIAGMFSFLNAGSGSNQSNHMYKLGPIHQGVVERGSKTTSDSYILWPAKVGAFTLIMGRHTTHPDTTNLPFSYLIENNNESHIVPAANLRSVGTIRDAQKWPKRDKRKDPKRLDQINYNLLSPYTIQKMYAGIALLKELQNISGRECSTYYYQNTRMKESSLIKGIELYRKGIMKFLGNSIIKRLECTRFTSIEEIRERLKPDTKIGLGEWVDLSGLILPLSEVTKIIKKVESGEYDSIQKLNDYFAEVHQNYYTYEWTWAVKKLEEELGKGIEDFTIEDIIGIVKEWKEAVISLDKMLYEDAKKEFTLTTRTGFGADGDEEQKKKDFENVRGVFEQNPFVVEVQRHIKVKRALGDELIERIKDI